MALTIETAKLELAKWQKMLQATKDMGIDAPEMVNAQIEKLTKFLAGNTSENLCKLFNEQLTGKINASAPMLALFVAALGTSKGKLTFTVNPEGQVLVEAAGASTHVGGNIGGTRSDARFNHYILKGIDGSVIHEEGAKGGADMLKYILNPSGIVGKNNPLLNLPTDWHSGDSANRALESIQKNESFVKNYVLVMEYVAPEAKAPEATATA